MSTKKRHTDKSRQACIPILPGLKIPKKHLVRETVEGLKKEKDWPGIINLLEPLAERHKKDHWVHVQLSMAHRHCLYHDERASLAIDHLLLAADIAPDCPCVGLEFARQYEIHTVYAGGIPNLFFVNYSLGEMMDDSCCPDIKVASQVRDEGYKLMLKLYKKIKKPKAAAALKKRYEKRLKREREANKAQVHSKVL